MIVTYYCERKKYKNKALQNSMNLKQIQVSRKCVYVLIKLQVIINEIQKQLLLREVSQTCYVYRYK